MHVWENIVSTVPDDLKLQMAKQLSVLTAARISTVATSRLCLCIVYFQMSEV